MTNHNDQFPKHHQIPDDALRELRLLYHRHLGIFITLEEARERGEKILALMNLFYAEFRRQEETKQAAEPAKPEPIPPEDTEAGQRRLF